MIVNLDSRPAAVQPAGTLPVKRGTPRVEFTHSMECRLLDRLGADEWGKFPCPIPRHDPRRATLVENERGEPALGCCTGRRRSLGEVRAATAYGFDTLRTNKEIAVWTRLLAWELHGFQPASVTLPAPWKVPAYVTVVAEGFALLCGLRWADWPKGPVSFSVRFAAAWCRLSFGKAATGLNILKEQGVICEVGREGLIHLLEPGARNRTGEVVTVPRRPGE